MKPITVILSDGERRQDNFRYLLEVIEKLPENEAQEVVIRHPKQSKTMRQLGTLFGLWSDYLVEQVPAYSHEPPALAKKQLHQEMKAQFLAGIYAKEPEGYIQEMWVEKLVSIGERITSPDKATALKAKQDLSRHFAECSLSWASIKQMSEYMDAVYWYWHGEGYIPPVPDKFHKYHKAEAEKMRAA